MQKKEYTGIEMEINIFASKEVIVASSVTPTEKPEFDGTQDSDDLPIL